MAYRSTSLNLDSSSDDNSDAEEEISWKRSRHNESRPSDMEATFTNPVKVNGAANGSGDAPSGSAAVGSKPAARKRNNIWGNVIQEEALTKSLTTSAMNPYERTRGMESYDYTSKDRLEAEREDREMEEYWNKRPVKNRLGTQGDTEVSMEDDRPDLRASHAQQPAADDDFFDTKPSVRDRLEIKPNVRDRLGESGDNRGSYRKRGSRGQVTEADMYSDVKKRLGRKPDCNSSNFRMGTTKYVALKADDSVEKIVNGLCVNLNEPKVALMARVVDCLGPKKAIQLMHETEMVEETGGLMVLNGSRRRTPGGVFLFLLRNDPGIEKQTRNEIFKEDKKELQERHKKIRAKRRQRERSEVEKAERALQQAHQPMEDNEMSTETCEQSMEGDHTGQGHPRSSEQGQQSSEQTMDDQPSGSSVTAAQTSSASNTDDIFSTTPLAEGEALPETDTFGVTKDQPKAQPPTPEDGEVSDDGLEAGAADVVETRAEDAEGGTEELEEGEIED